MIHIKSICIDLNELNNTKCNLLKKILEDNHRFKITFVNDKCTMEIKEAVYISQKPSKQSSLIDLKIK